MAKNRKMLLTMASVFVVAIGSVSFWLRPESAASEDLQRAPKSAQRTVHTEKVTAISQGSEVRLSSVTRARDRNKAAFSIPGRLTERRVNVGDTVKKGQILARLEPDTMLNFVGSAQAALSEMDARFDKATRDLDRSQKLAEVGAVPSATSENASSAVAALEAGRRAARVQVNEAKRQLAQTVLRAPFDGVISAVYAEPGEVVGAGTPIVTLSGDDRVEVEIDVPESLVGGLSETQTVRVDLPFLRLQGITGQIETVGRVSAGYGRLFPVIVTLPQSEEIRPGLTAEIVLRTAAVEGIAVPVEAIINPSGQRASVLRVDQGRVDRVFVDTGELVDSRVIVRGPLTVNDDVVVSGHTQLLHGEQVEVHP